MSEGMSATRHGVTFLGRPLNYRERVKAKDLVSFSILEKETNLYVAANENLQNKTRRLVRKYRAQVEKYIVRRPEFHTSLVPLAVNSDAPLIVRSMLEAGQRAGVGPMAAVAGAIAEFTGKELLSFSPEVIIENGGDIFLCITKTRAVGVYAGDSPFSGKIGIEIRPEETPAGVCTSSGTVGHSFSTGKADAVVVISRSAPLADAAATAIANMIKSPNDITKGLEKALAIDGVTGVLIIKDDKMGSSGKVTLCRT